MKLRELFDRNVPYDWITQLPNERYTAKFIVDKKEYRFSAHIFSYDEGLRGAEISFCMKDGLKCRTDNTGTGNADIVYGTVILLIREVASILKLSRVAYDAEDDKRKNIYPMLIKKALPGWKLADHADDWFYFDRPRNKMNEAFGDDWDTIKVDGGKIQIWPNAPHAPRSASVIEFVVDEDKRNQGIGDKLVKMAMHKYPDLGAQVSSVASLKVFYNNGFRNPKIQDASFEEHIEAFKENGGSLFLANNY
jgi:GNAT superfamily N-acetyltransferase